MTAGALRLLTAAALICAMFACAPAAHAGTWMLVSCVNPDGSAAPSDGWAAFTQGTVIAGDGNNTHCAPGVPMSAFLGTAGVAANGDSETLQFTPPAGSTLAGGSLDAAFTAYGGHAATGVGGATAQADVLEPQDSLDQGDTVFSCINQFGCGASGVYAYSGPVSLPASRGGNLYVTAICTATPGFQCDQNVGGSNGYWSRAEVSSAHLLLSNGAAPQGTLFSGTALQRNARGTAHVVFTATDMGGPGIYSITVAIDGHAVYAGTPNTNDGACVPVGIDQASGALMFDFAQPCPVTEVADAPVPTAGLPDGRHDLAVTVTDAAHNSSTVLDQNITTSNPQTTPNPSGHHALHARFVISWHWNGATTLLRAMRVTHLPRSARVTVHCAGKHCPRLGASANGPRRVAKMLRGLAGRHLRAGQSLFITVTAPRHTAERIVVRIRNGVKPSARLLR
ncbi:MAG TPA: hypothetical protein VHW96_06505 [Solirubrobacteraceae bacterium]|jgi:hypothetical protein|nr:hypothetical protein [Solirubrobacteraceae bacterium]